MLSPWGRHPAAVSLGAGHSLPPPSGEAEPAGPGWGSLWPLEGEDRTSPFMLGSPGSPSLCHSPRPALLGPTSSGDQAAVLLIQRGVREQGEGATKPSLLV